MERHLVFSDTHCIQGQDLSHCDIISDAILAFRPTVVVNLGDFWDMSSLCNHDRGKASFFGRSYRADIDVGLEAHERIWGPVRKANFMPRRVFCEGNHEERIRRAIDMQPELEGAIGYNDLALSNYYDDIVPYRGNFPDSINIHGITYAHFLTSGAMGRPIQTEHAAYTLIMKKLVSCVVGHSHRLNYAVRTREDGFKVHGLVCPMATPHDLLYAGSLNRHWDRGIVLLDNVENGSYDLRTIRFLGRSQTCDTETKPSNTSFWDS